MRENSPFEGGGKTKARLLNDFSMSLIEWG